MEYSARINDDVTWAITAAREAYNASIPATIFEDDDSAVPNPLRIETDVQYLHFVIGRAIQSWAVQHAESSTPPPPPAVDVTDLNSDQGIEVQSSGMFSWLKGLIS